MYQEYYTEQDVMNTHLDAAGVDESSGSLRTLRRKRPLVKEHWPVSMKLGLGLLMGLGLAALITGFANKAVASSESLNADDLHFAY